MADHKGSIGVWIGVLFGLVMSLTGCWDVTSSETITVPVLMAIDWHQGQYVVTVESDAPQLLHSPGASSGSSSTRPTWINSGRGPSFTAAMVNTGLDVLSGNPLTMAHLRVVIIGRSALSPKVLPGILDHLDRAPYLHRTFWVLGSQGPAAKVAEVENPIGPDPVVVLERVLKVAQKHGWAHPPRFYQILETWDDTPYLGTVIPILTMSPEPGMAMAQQFQLAGSWVLLGPQKIGQWSRSQAGICAMLMNYHPSLLVPITAPHAVYVFRMVQSHNNLTWSRGSLNVKTSVSVSLAEVDGDQTSPPSAAWMAQQVSYELSREIMQFIGWTQTHHVDVLGAGLKAEAKHPHWFQENESRWSEIYGNVPVHLTVKVSIRDAGSLSTY